MVVVTRLHYYHVRPPLILIVLPQELALTTKSLDDTEQLPMNLDDLYLSDSRAYWQWWRSTVRHGGEKKRISEHCSLFDVGVDQTAGMCFTSTGILYLLIDGEVRGMGWKGLPTDEPLWGVADVYKRCTKIKLEQTGT